MSIASVGSLGSTNNKTAGQTLSMSPSSTVPVGHLIVVFVGWEGDRLYSDAGGLQDIGLACTDSVGNVYTELQSGLYDVSSSIFMTYVETALTTGGSITITHRSAGLVAKAMSAWEFSIGNGMRPAAWRNQLSARETGPGNPVDPVVVSGLDSGTEYLILHVLANKRPLSDSYTWDSDYTQITADGTTGGGAGSNVTLRGGFRIVSGITGDTVAVTDTTNIVDTDCWQGIIPISEVEYDDNFPTFPNFDDFNRADEDPLTAAHWIVTDPVVGLGTALLRVVSNQCARSASGSGHGAQVWNVDIPAGDDGEVFVTVPVWGAGSQQAGVHCFAAGAANVSTLGGYAIYWSPVAGAQPDALAYGDTGFNGGLISTGLIVWKDRVDGYKMGLQMRLSGSVIHLWADFGSGWRWVSGTFRTAFVSNGGKFGLNAVNNTLLRFDDFGGGTSSPFLPQIIRRLPVNR